ncbi:MAG: DUF4215 domain-containing protein, partial [Deltaproteobacteria bacterium]|nr:DUF4215 domain-containing protein [Deltaproteobacteria bacterium]
YCNSCVCKQPICGDGTIDPGETCDDNNTVDGDGCDSNCTPTGCGNGIVTGSEDCGELGLTCDTANGFYCNSCVCKQPICGDGTIDPGETCDDHNNIDNDGCDSNCTPSKCGNGVIDAGEFCDGSVRNDICRSQGLSCLQCASCVGKGGGGGVKN